jgi:REP element-mobilizing transposase RayT
MDHGGNDVEHRKQWVERRLRLLSRQAACDVASYAVMSNHLHVVLRMRPERAAGWSAREVVCRWLAIWPRERLPDGTAVMPGEAEILRLAADAAQVARWRGRLSDLGWTMKALKENLARRANKEDGCSGAFWEGRFKSVPLLDQAALVACMAYVDLNPIRAKVADRPEQSRFTGAYERIQARKTVRAAAKLRRLGKADAARDLLHKAGIDARLSDADKACWLTPIAVCVNDGRPLSLDEYLTLVDMTGRIIREGKRGAIPAALEPILRRLDIDIDNWVACMLGFRQFLGAAVGSVAARVVEAGRRGLQWMQNRCKLFANGTQQAHASG